MIKVSVYKQSNYPIKSSNIKKALKVFLNEKGIVSDTQVEVSLVSEAKMIELAKKFCHEKNSVHNVLSFPTAETKDRFLTPIHIIDLGEIVVCFPKAKEEASVMGILIEERVVELVLHGAMHLMGIHHK